MHPSDKSRRPSWRDRRAACYGWPHADRYTCAMAELDSQPKSVQSLYAWFNEDKLHVNRRYQRKLVWTLEEKQKLIESILKKYPVPAILLAERDEGGYEIIDGLQRLHSLVSFVETSFPDLGGKHFDVSAFPTAQTRANEGKFVATDDTELLSSREVNTFLDYSLAVSVMRGATEAEIDDVFSRINTYGHRLSDQERRQAGVQDRFSALVRNLACDIRGDASTEVLNLTDMPSISIDLPKTRHGYQVAAEGVFWVSQGVLRSTDLRDSMDEQCLADIASCIVGGEILERSKDALDDVYASGSARNQQVVAALSGHGAERFADELKYCIDEVIRVVELDKPNKLRSIIFAKSSTSPFPSAFAVLMIALHESLVKGNKKISDYSGIRKAITGLYSRIETSRGSTAPAERRKNIDTIKGLIDGYLVDNEPPAAIYGAHASVDIDVMLRRSTVELPHYELKQGYLTLSEPPKEDLSVFSKVINTICAMANNGRKRTGSIVIGVADKDADAARIKKIFGTESRSVGQRHVVGVNREAQWLGITPEQYFVRWRDAIKNSDLSPSLRDSVLGNLDQNDYYGLGVIVINVPAQAGVSFVGDKLYSREADQTIEVTSPPRIAEVISRFT